MTRRERLENKLQKRLQWAESRREQSTAAYEASRRATEHIPMGQPILVGHHSEGMHRAALKRSDNAMRRSCESSAMAKHHESKAAGIEAQLESSIFSDDPDAIEQLEAKLARMEGQREEYKKLNAHWRKHKSMKGFPGLSDEAAARLDADIPQRYSWERQPIPAYRLQNLGAEIRRVKLRIEEVKKRQARSAMAEASGGIVIEGDEWVRITFADKPAREILNALKASGFRWGAGSWIGRRDQIPQSVRELLPQ